MKAFSWSAALAAALASVPGLGQAAVASQSEAVQQRQLRHALGGGSSVSSPRSRGPGWSQAHVKRMARKRRNVIRNRRAHGGRS